MPRQPLRIALPTVLVTLSAAVGCAAAPAVPVLASAPIQTATVADTSRLSISGTAAVRLPADRAEIVLSVVTEGETARAASQANADRADAVLQALRPLLGSDDQLETRGYRVDPRYRTERPESGPEIRSYRVQNEVVVVTSDIDGVGAILDAALDAGANQVSRLAFGASDDREARLEAIRRAVQAARAEAEVTAAALGLRLGAILDVRTNVGSGGQPRAYAAAMEVRAATPIEAGSEEVRATVSIVWALEAGAL